MCKQNTILILNWIVWIRTVCVIHPCRPPQLINFFKPILFMASDSSSGFRRSISHFFTATKNITERVGEKTKQNKRTNTDLGQLQGLEKEFCVTILFSFLWACIFRETYTKATRNTNSSLSVFPHSLLLLTVLPLDCYLTPTGLFCPPLSSTFSGFSCQLTSLFSLTSLSSSTSNLAGDLKLKPFVWVSRQNRHRDRLPGAHTHIVSHLIELFEIVTIELCISAKLNSLK